MGQAHRVVLPVTTSPRVRNDGLSESAFISYNAPNSAEHSGVTMKPLAMTPCDGGAIIRVHSIYTGRDTVRETPLAHFYATLQVLRCGHNTQETAMDAV